MMLPDVCLSVWRLSRTSGKSRIRLRLQLAQRQPTSHMTRTSLSRLKS